MHLPCAVFEIRRVLSKFDNLDLPHLHLAPPLGVIPFEFQEDFGIKKLEFLGYHEALFNCVSTFSYFSTTPTCDTYRQTQTPRHPHTHGHHSIYRAAQIARAVKIAQLLQAVYMCDVACSYV